LIIPKYHLYKLLKPGELSPTTIKNKPRRVLIFIVIDIGPAGPLFLLLYGFQSFNTHVAKPQGAKTPHRKFVLESKERRRKVNFNA